MSTFQTPLMRVQEVKKHPGADRLDLVTIGGWQVAVPKGSHKEDELVLYICPDAVVSDALADRWGIRQLAADGSVQSDYRGKGGRVKAIKLRGEPSFGFTVKLKDIGPELATYAESHLVQDGEDLSGVLGIVKYVPTVKDWTGTQGGRIRGDSVAEHVLFKRYTGVENIKWFNDLFTESEEVLMVEKIHGTNSRSAYINGEFMAGSHKVQRRDPNAIVVLDDNDPILVKAWKWFKIAVGWAQSEQIGPRNPGSSVYWHPIENVPGVRELLYDLGATHGQAILFGEIYGPKIQPFDYGVPEGQVRFVAFDIMLNGKYVDYDEFEAYCTLYKIPMAPLLYRGPYSKDVVAQYSTGPSTMGGSHVREGVVIRPVHERTDPRMGRVIVKSINPDYYIQQVDDVQEAAENADEVAA